MRYPKPPSDGRPGASVRWIFATAADRLAFRPMHTAAPVRGDRSDVGGEAWQLSDDTFWCLKSGAPLTWVSKSSGGGTPAQLSADFSGDTTITAAAGPPTDTIDIPIPDDAITWVDVRATGTGGTSGLQMVYTCTVAVRAASGTVDLPFGAFIEQFAAESGSTWDSTWVARSASSGNMRLTLKGDTGEDIAWHVEADFRPGT